MKLILTAVSGSREGKVFTIEANECITFGRSSLSKWSFEDDRHMSTVHFEVANLGAVGEVRDHNSTNGTWLNNEKIDTATLREGDRIRAGKTILTVEFLNDFVPAVIVEPDGDLDEIEQSQAPTPGEEIENFLPEPERIPDFHHNNPPRAAEKPAFEPLPIPGTGEKVRKINPFDSVDFAELNVPSPPANNSHPHDRDEIQSPISDSSFFGTPAPAKRSQYELLSRLTSAEAAESFAIVLDTLVSKWSVQLVVHFQKVRIATPSECESKPILRDLSNPEAASYIPVRVDWSDINSEIVMPLMPRLCRSDACLAFFGRSSMEIGNQLETISSMGVEGFSEPGGFLPYFWPSSLISIVEARGKGVCDQLFAGRIAGAIFCAPFCRNEIFAIANREFSEDLQTASFRGIERLAAGK